MLNEKSTFTLTLGKIVTIVIAIMGMAFTIGMTYQQVLPDKELQRKQSEEIADIKVTLSRVTTILENMEKKTATTSANVSALQSKAHVANVQLELISANLKEQKQQRRRRNGN